MNFILTVFQNITSLPLFEYLVAAFAFCSVTSLIYRVMRGSV